MRGNGKLQFVMSTTVAVGVLAIVALSVAGQVNAQTVGPEFGGTATSQLTTDGTATAEATVTLSGHVLPGLAALSDLGPLSADQPISLTIALRPPAPAALHDAALRARSTGGTLDPATAGQIYGRSPAELASLAAYFASWGLTVRPAAADRLSFQVTGSIAEVQGALGVSMHAYRDRENHAFFATNAEPRLPARLAGLIQTIYGLDNYPAIHAFNQGGHHFAGTPSATTATASALGATSASVSPGQLTPSEMQSAYNLGPLYASNVTGLGQTIGVLGCWAFSPTDVANFQTWFGLPVSPITVIPIDSAAGGQGINAETTLDLEWASAIAPNASFDVYSFPNVPGTADCSNQAIYDGLVRAVNDNTASVLNLSFGECESGISTSLTPTIASFENEFAQAALHGQSVLVASGDRGAYECTDGSGNPALGVAYPASSAFVTAVGGTTLHLNSDASYASESTWGSPTGCQGSSCGSGGGVSFVIAKPAWQNAVNSTNFREVPDVAYNADPSTGNAVFYGGNWYSGFGGTSIGTPQWAGLSALADQSAARRLGLLNPLLYGTTQSPTGSSSSPYHDVTTGNNLYYSAQSGWDMATGWGSPNAALLIEAVTGSTSAPVAASGTPTSNASVPIVTGIQPTTGSTEVPIDATIYGTNFQPGAQVSLVSSTTSQSLPGVVANNSSTISAVVSAGLTPGTYDVVVTNPDGTSGRLSGVFSVNANVSAAPNQARTTIYLPIVFNGAGGE